MLGRAPTPPMETRVLQVGVWSGLIGQSEATGVLSRAVADAHDTTNPGPAMSHAWLVTGPPGSGRSTAAGAFAAALQCPQDGCGECAACRTALSGAHPDVHIVRSDTLSYGVDDARELIVRSAVVPTTGPWHIVIVEDADRFTDDAANTLLKVLEEPPRHLVWVLCAPSAEDVLPTVRSRTRSIHLRTPSTQEVAAALQEHHDVEPAMAAFAARASQGHIGRARALARDENTRTRRQEVLRIPSSLRDLPACFAAAAHLLESATQDARSITDDLDAREAADLRRAYGEGADGVSAARIDRIASRAMKDLEKAQKSRRTRSVRDQVDRALVDLMAYYRDVLVVQFDGTVPLINDEMRPQIQAEAALADPAETTARLEALDRCRQSLAANGALPLIVEGLMVELKDPYILAR
jgi:DNA polymerase-3 subunit delta'